MTTKIKKSVGTKFTIDTTDYIYKERYMYINICVCGVGSKRVG